MSDRVQQLLQWSSEYSADQPDLAALLARAASLLLTRAPKRVVDLPTPIAPPVVRLPTVAPGRKPPKRAPEILALLRELPGLTAREVSQYLNFSENNAFTTLRDMSECRLVRPEQGVRTSTSGMGKAPMRWFVWADKGKEEIA